MTILDFQERFATEEACRDYLFACRWPDGFRCRRCRGAEIGVMHSARRLWQCKRCGAQTSVTAGTVMHGTRMPLRLWFWAAYLVATHHPGISAVQLQRQLGIRRHETAWMMLHKLRAAMVAPQREPLKREVEVDEFFLGGLEEGRRGGRARGKKALCGVVVEVRGRGRRADERLPISEPRAIPSGAPTVRSRFDRRWPLNESYIPVKPMPNQITAANAGERLGFAGKSRLGFSHRSGVAEFCRSTSA